MPIWISRAAIVLCALLFVCSPGSVAAQTPQPAQPLARITSPVREQTLRGSVQIQGTATAPGFSRYEVSYASEPNLQNWTLIGGGTLPVDNGFLASWNTRPVPDGGYALRLQVFTTDGKVIDMPSAVRNLTLQNGISAPGAAVTGTSALSGTQAVSPTRGSAAGSDAGAPEAAGDGFDLGSIPRAFARGMQLAAAAFVVLGVYLLLKALIGAAIRRLRQRNVDYGR